MQYIYIYINTYIFRINRKPYQKDVTGDVYELPNPKYFPNFFKKIEIPTEPRKIMKNHQI